MHADHLGASTYIEKGWSLISLGDYTGAIQALDKALTLSPGAVQAQSLLGWAQMLDEDYDEALGNFSKVLMKEPANALARINVGYICLKKGIFGEAIEHLSKAIRLDNDRKATSTRTTIWGWCTSSGRCTKTRRRSFGRRSSWVPT